MSTANAIPSPLPVLECVPFDPQAKLYVSWPQYIPHTYTNWREETLSWKKGCYLSANLSVYPDFVFQGPDVIKLLSYASVNSWVRFPEGSAKHIICCNKVGNIIGHGVARRTGEDSIKTMSDCLYLEYLIEREGFNVKMIPQEETFLFQVAGPRSLEVLEQAAQEDLHDIKFMRFREATIAGHKIRILRMGMVGTLGYEVFGKGNEVGIVVYNELFRIGQDYGMKKLGANQYCCNHTENGFPEYGIHWAGDYTQDEEYAEFLRKNNAAVGDDPDFDYMDDTSVIPRGTYSDDPACCYHNPFELGWGHSVNFKDHDFIGKEALQEIANSPHREMVTLEWNPEDIMRCLHSYFEQGDEPYMDMPFPQEHRDLGITFNNIFNYKVMKDGELVGQAMWRTYTLYYRAMISLCCIEPEFAKIGTDVTLVYGDVGKRTIDIRAKVARYPYLDLASNKKFDIETIPHFHK